MFFYLFKAGVRLQEDIRDTLNHLNSQQNTEFETHQETVFINNEVELLHETDNVSIEEV